MQDKEIRDEILTRLRLQLHSNFGRVDFQNISLYSDEAYGRCMESISASRNQYLKHGDGSPKFSVNHSGCWSLYLYYLANTISRHDQRRQNAEQIYYLNKILHGVDWYCEVELPRHFMVEHPVGSVLGKAQYGDYLVIYQGVTVGGSIELNTGKTLYPVLGNNVVMYSDSKILGNCKIGNNVVMSANACAVNENVPDNSIVFGKTPDLVIKCRPQAVRTCMADNWNIQ